MSKKTKNMKNFDKNIDYKIKSNGNSGHEEQN